MYKDSFEGCIFNISHHLIVLQLFKIYVIIGFFDSSMSSPPLYLHWEIEITLYVQKYRIESCPNMGPYKHITGSSSSKMDTCYEYSFKRQKDRADQLSVLAPTFLYDQILDPCLLWQHILWWNNQVPNSKTPLASIVLLMAYKASYPHLTLCGTKNN